MLDGCQVVQLLKEVDPEFIAKFVLKVESIFLNSFPVTPNCHRVTEIMHTYSNAQRLIFVSVCTLNIPFYLLGDFG